MPEVWHDLIGDAPDAAPAIVDVVADSPGVANLSSPIANVCANPPLTDVVVYVAVCRI